MLIFAGSSICSRHFVSTDFRDFLSRKCLKKSAVPSIMTKKTPTYNVVTLNGNQLNKNHMDDVRVTQLSHISNLNAAAGLDSAHIEQSNNGKLTEGISCGLCGEMEDDTIDINGLMNMDDTFVATMLKKIFPTTLLRHESDANVICMECTQLLRLFSDFVDKVLAYQKEIREKGMTMNESCCSSEISYNNEPQPMPATTVPTTSTAASAAASANNFKEMGTNTVFIKQEPINVKQEIMEITNKRSAIQSEYISSPLNSFSVFAQNLPDAIRNMPTSTASFMSTTLERGMQFTRGSGHTNSFCGFCDRIFVNNFELESHACNRGNRRKRDNSNNCEIMEIITLNNSMSFIDLAEDEYAPMNRAMKVEHLSEFERRERIESDHAYAKRIDTYNQKLKQEVIYDSTDSSESNIEVYEPSNCNITVDLSHNNSGNESDINRLSSPDGLVANTIRHLVNGSQRTLTAATTLAMLTAPPATTTPSTTAMVTTTPKAAPAATTTCDKCDIHFDSVRALQEHCRSMHSLKNKICSVCSADFKSIHDYLVHKNKMHAVGHQCSQCRRTFAFKNALLNHKRFSCSPGTSDIFYSCKYCGKRFRNRMSMNDHFKMCSAVILEEESKESCETKIVVPAATVTIESNPIAAEINANDKPVVRNILACHICGSRFSKKFNLVSLVACGNVSRLKLHVTKTYFLFFFSLQNRHMQCHRPKSDQSVKCTVRAELFQDQDERKCPLASNICNITNKSVPVSYEFRVSDLYNGQVGNHSSIFSLAPSPMPQLSWTTSLASTATATTTTATATVTTATIANAKLKDDSIKRHYPFVCETCGKAFLTYPNLKQHTFSHVNERKFTCHLCPKVFKRSTGLNQVRFFYSFHSNYVFLYIQFGLAFVRK